jgi:predicted N-formylglutamate amidohydrolase
MLLTKTDPEPVIVENEGARSPFLLVCDHAGRAVPAALGDLGVSAAEMERHIAWDIGALALTRAVAVRLDAAVVAQRYSRLVIDCNRDPVRADAMPVVSDGTPIPANAALTPESRAARVAAIHEPYHARIAALLDARAASGLGTVLVLVHSFTPVMAGVPRPWLFGVLHKGGPLAVAALRLLREGEGPIGDNQPYAMDDVDYTAFRHGRARGLPFLELETRQDLLADDAGVERVAGRLAALLTRAWAEAGPAAA